MTLALRASRAIIWAIITSVGSRGIGLISTLILTRFLTPVEYGAVAVAVVVVSNAVDLTEMGLLQYVAAKPKAGRDAVFQASLFHIIIGIVALSIVVVLREPLGHAFDGGAKAISYIAPLALAELCMRLAQPPERVLFRDLKIIRMELWRVVSEVLYAVTAVVLAIYGFGGLAIVYGDIVQWGFFLVAVMLLAPRRDWFSPAPLSWKTSRELFSFGLPLSVGRIADAAGSSWDKLIVSRFFGLKVLGLYNLAKQLGELPGMHIGHEISLLLLPSFARMDPEERRPALVRATRLLVLVMAPMGIGLACVAPTLTAVLFDARWQEMGPMLMVLALLSLVRPIGRSLNSYLQAVDAPRAVMLLEILKGGLVLGLIFMTGSLGPRWAAAAVVVGFTGHGVASAWAAHVCDEVSFGAMLATVPRPTLATAPMVGAIVLVHYMLAGTTIAGGVLALIIEIAVGGIVFVPSAFIIAPTAAKDLWGVFRRALSSRRISQEAELATAQAEPPVSAEEGPSEP